MSLWPELVAFAGTADKARLRVRDGIYRRVLRNASVLADVPDTPDTRLAALHRVVPPHVVLSHCTALWALGLDVLPRDADQVDLLDLTTARGLRLAPRPGVRIDAAVDRAGGLRWVSRAREAVPHLEARSESLMESRLRVGFVLAGGPRMHAQVDLYDEERRHRGRADLFLDGVAVEYDGRAERLLRERFGGDRPTVAEAVPRAA